jgi:phosphate transport system protein
MKRFERELAQLKHRIVEMGALAESMAVGASAALIDAERSAIAQVRANEPRLDGFQIEIDREAIRLITVYSPVARDLRLLLMMARINSELERIGDQAVDNCKYVEILPSDASPKPLRELSKMSAMTLLMVHDALQAFEHEDIGKAQAVIGLDDQVDAMNAETFRSLLEHETTNPALVTRGIGLILAAQSLERIADHATNICEEVFYLVEGEDIRHRT